MTVLFFIDILMFLYTVLMISKKIEDTRFINHPDRKRKIDHDKQRCVHKKIINKYENIIQFILFIFDYFYLIKDRKYFYYNSIE